MRKLILLLTVATVVVSCKSEPKTDYVLISGKIENPLGRAILISGENFQQEINLNENGAFADTLKLASNGYYSLLYGRENTTIYLKQGDDLIVDIDPKRFDDPITYEGIGADVNNYLATKFLANKEVVTNPVPHYSLDEEAYKQKLEETQTEYLKLLSALSSDKEFVELEKKELTYEKLLGYSSYERMHAYYAKKQGFKVSNGFLPEALANMSFDSSEDYNQFSSYKSLALNKYMGQVIETLGEDFQHAAPEDFKVFEEIKIPAIKNDIISQIGSVLVSPGNPNMVPLYNFFMTHTTDDTFKRKLTVKYNNNKSLVRGMPSPQFTDYENHKGGTMSLTDLKGKYVYIDVWATWCGPCKREIPYLKEIETKYHGKNIEFVSTSIDRMQDHEAWVEMVKERQLSGHQLFADKDWQSDFVKGYAIEGIPRFILIDPDGNIVSADAPRPSNPKLIELFNELKI